MYRGHQSCTTGAARGCVMKSLSIRCGKFSGAYAMSATARFATETPRAPATRRVL